MNKKSNFNGEMLKDARIYRGLTMTELAEMSNLHRQSISQYELGENTPTFETLTIISKVLNFPREYFYQRYESNIKVYNTYFRALLSSNKKDRQAQENKTEKTILIYNFLSKYLDFPKLDIKHKRIKNINDVERVALEIREEWNLGLEPINNMVHLLEKKGIIVSAFNTDKHSIDAFSQKAEIDDEELFCVVLGNDKESATRRQFCAAHELGHIVMHEWNCDLEELTKEEFRQREIEANLFAAAFLMPKESFLKDLLYEKTLEYYIELKKKWKVSISAMIVRAHQLKAITTNQYQYLMRQISQRGWKVKEPLDDSIIREQPSLFKKAISILIDNNILTKREIIQELANVGLKLEIEELEILMSIEKDTLLEKEKVEIGEIVKLKEVKN